MEDKEQGTFVMHTPCPKCGSGSNGNGEGAGSLYDNNTWHCFSCGHHINNYDGEEEKPMEVKKKVSTFKEIEVSIKALKKRGISQKTCKKFGYGYGDKYDVKLKDTKRVQVAPYFWKGNLVAQHTRDADKEFRWGGNTDKLELFGQHLYKSSKGKRLIITEGEIDAMTMSQVFPTFACVSIPSGTKSGPKYLKQNLEFCEGYDAIILAFDNDKPGKELTDKAAPLFSNGKVKVVNWLDYKDANEALLADGIDGKQYIVNRFFEAQDYRPDGILSGKDLYDEMLEFKNSKEIYGYNTGYPILDDKLRGFWKGKVYTVISGSGLGKSTVVGEIAYNFMMNHELKIGYCALEDTRVETGLRMMSIHTNKRLNIDKDSLTEEEFIKAMKETLGSGRFFLHDHFGSLDSANLINKLRFMAIGCEVDWIIFDHISMAVAGEETNDERKMIDVLMTALVSIAKKVGVGIIVVSHLKKANGPKSHEEGAEVSSKDIRGSNCIYQSSDAVIALNGSTVDEDNMNIRRAALLKNRLTGDTGRADVMKYNKITGRLLPHVPEQEPDGFDDETLKGSEDEGGEF